MPSIYDVHADRLEHAFSANGNATASLLTVTQTGVALRAHSVVKVDASYSVSTVSGLLTVALGSTTLGTKYIHGAGALDFAADVGYLDTTGGVTFTATLDSGGGGIVGTIVMSGFTTYLAA